MSKQKPKERGSVSITLDVVEIKYPHLHLQVVSGDADGMPYRVGVAANGTAAYIFIDDRVLALPLFEKEDGPVMQLVKAVREQIVPKIKDRLK
jgi:hypothetical protein